jgi:hypothetical protein
MTMALEAPGWMTKRSGAARLLWAVHSGQVVPIGRIGDGIVDIVVTDEDARRSVTPPAPREWMSIIDAARLLGCPLAALDNLEADRLEPTNGLEWTLVRRAQVEAFDALNIWWPSIAPKDEEERRLARMEIEIDGAQATLQSKDRDHCFFARSEINSWRARLAAFRSSGGKVDLKASVLEIATAVNDHIVTHRQEPGKVTFFSSVHRLAVTVHLNARMLDDLKCRRLIIKVGSKMFRRMGEVHDPAMPSKEARERVYRYFGPLPADPPA